MDALRDLFTALRAQRLRAASTLFGVAWGTFSVVLLLAFGTGLERRMMENAHNMGRGLVVAWPSKTTRPFEGLGKERRLRVTADDVLRLPEEIPEILALSPEYQGRENVRIGERVHRARLSGVYPDYGWLRAWRLEPGGRFINDRDIAEHRRVVVLGDAIKRGLLGDGPAIGATIVLANAPFTVIGVLAPKKQSSDYGGPDDQRVCLPATTHAQVFGRRHVDTIIFRARSPELTATAIDGFYRVLARRYRFDPRDRDAIVVWDTTEEDRMLSYVFLGLHLVLGGAGAMTLIVAGLGVANLMYILVSQQTHEIGVRLAFGSRPRRVLVRVMAQATALVTVGGAAGLGAAWVVLGIVRTTPVTADIGTPQVAPLVALSIALLLGAVALLAGFFPARRASRLDPVAALSRTDATVLASGGGGGVASYRGPLTRVILAVAWGTFGLAVAAACGAGFDRALDRAMDASGRNVLRFWSGATTRPWRGLDAGRWIGLEPDDARAIERSVPGVRAASVEYADFGETIEVDGVRVSARVHGVDPAFGAIRHIVPGDGGRFLNELDVKVRRRVAVLGDRVKGRLFGDGNAVGRTVELWGVPFVVVGVMRPKVTLTNYEGNDYDKVFIPAPTFRAIRGWRWSSYVIVGLEDESFERPVRREVYRLIGRRRGFDPDDRYALGFYSHVEVVRMQNLVVGGVRMLLVIAGALGLLVAIVGVANLMYVLVDEQRRDTALRLALGARPKRILLRVTAAGLLVTGFGGVLGILASAVFVMLLRILPIDATARAYLGYPQLSLPLALAVVAVLAVAGTIAASWPARRAASIDPVEVLRDE